MNANAALVVSKLMSESAYGVEKKTYVVERDG